MTASARKEGRAVHLPPSPTVPHASRTERYVTGRVKRHFTRDKSRPFVIWEYKASFKSARHIASCNADRSTSRAEGTPPRPRLPPVHIRIMKLRLMCRENLPEIPTIQQILPGRHRGEPPRRSEGPQSHILRIKGSEGQGARVEGGKSQRLLRIGLRVMRQPQVLPGRDRPSRTCSSSSPRPNIGPRMANI